MLGGRVHGAKELSMKSRHYSAVVYLFTFENRVILRWLRAGEPDHGSAVCPRGGGGPSLHPLCLAWAAFPRGGKIVPVGVSLLVGRSLRSGGYNWRQIYSLLKCHEFLERSPVTSIAISSLAVALWPYCRLNFASCRNIKNCDWSVSVWNRGKH
jgi:hypothetical protein